MAIVVIIQGEKPRVAGPFPGILEAEAWTSGLLPSDSFRYLEIEPPSMIDPIVRSVISQLQIRSEVGIQKYGKTLDRDDLTPFQWIQHLQEELMDAINYLEVLKTKVNQL